MPNIYAASATNVVVSTSATNMTNGQVAGNTAILDNSVDNYEFALVTVSVPGFLSTPTAGKVLSVSIRRLNTDLTTYQTGGSSVTSTPATPSGLASADGLDLVAVLSVSATAATQTMTTVASIDGVKMANFVVQNDTGQTISAGAGNAVTVSVLPFTVKAA